MKKIVFYFLIITVFFVAKPVFADDVKINAGILPSIWYSTLHIATDNQVDIYGGIQNHSDTGFSFIATLYIDDTPTNTTEATSNPDTLIEIRSPWTASVGVHTIQLKITNITRLPDSATTAIGTDSLLSSESNKTTVTVNQNISVNTIEDTVAQFASSTLADITQTGQNITINNIETVALQSASSTIQAIDTIADTISNTLENAKQKNSTSSQNTHLITDTNNAQKQSASNFAAAMSSVTNSPIWISFYNGIITALSWLVKNWKITTFATIVIVALIKFMV